MKALHLPPLALGLVLAGNPCLSAESNSAEAWMVRQGYVAPTRTEIIGCHGYGCARRTSIAVGSGWLVQAETLLHRAGSSPGQERQALGQVVSAYTRALAAAFGGRPDRPRSPPALSGVPGQMDCLDTTANTVSLLLVLEDRGLLAYHRVDAPQSRGVFFDGRYPHFTAVIREKGTNARWVVDPWTRAPGERPDIMPLKVWDQAA